MITGDFFCKAFVGKSLLTKFDVPGPMTLTGGGLCGGSSEGGGKHAELDEMEPWFGADVMRNGVVNLATLRMDYWGGIPSRWVVVIMVIVVYIHVVIVDEGTKGNVDVSEHVLEGSDEGGGLDVTEIASVGDWVYEKGGVCGVVCVVIIFLVIIFLEELVNTMEIEESAAFLSGCGKTSWDSETSWVENVLFVT